MNEDSILHPSHWPDVWEDLARFMKADAAQWQRIVREAGIEPE